MSQKNTTERTPESGLSSHDLLAVARVIPHPWKKGQTRNVYEFPVTRKIIIEADPDVSESQILAMAERCQDKEIGLEITGGGYRMTLSPANAQAMASADEKTPTKKTTYETRKH